MIKPGSRVVDEAEVGDHHAIIPTGRTPNSGRLSPDEKRLFDLVARRFGGALSICARTRPFGGGCHVFGGCCIASELVPPAKLEAKGRVTLDAGWMVVDPPKSESDKTLPDVDVGCRIGLFWGEIGKKQTQPPKRFTDGTLLKAWKRRQTAR